MRESHIHLLLVTSVGCLIFLTNLGGPMLWDRDEPRNAGCAAEMLDRSDWVVPVFNGQLRGHKPILLYWLMMASYAVFGIDEFGARFFSAICGILSAWGTYFIGRRLFSPAAGVWSAIVLCSTLMFGVASRAATPDALLICLVTWSIAVYVLGAFPKPGQESDTTPNYFPRSWLVAALMYALMGLAVLTKGPVGLVLPTAVIGMFLLIVRLPESNNANSSGWMRALRILAPFSPIHFLKTCWSMRPITAILIATAVAAPWYIWVAFRTGGVWTYEFFWMHNVVRATESLEGHGGLPVVYYLVMLLVGFLPWSIFFAPVLIDAVRVFRTRNPKAAGYILACCWVGVYLVLFGIARTKLPSYITPCYPGVALLVGAFLDRWTRRETGSAKVWFRIILGSTAATAAAFFILVPTVLPNFFPGEGILAVIGILPLTAAVLGFYALRTDRRMLLAGSFAAVSVLLVAVIFIWVSERIRNHDQVRDMLAFARQRAGDDAQIGALSWLEPSWSFYLQKPVDELKHPNADLPTTNAKIPACADDPWERTQRENWEPYLTAHPKRFVITTREELQWITIPEQHGILYEVPCFTNNGHTLVLIGRTDAEATNVASESSDATVR